jgi:hypothetical protein
MQDREYRGRLLVVLPVLTGILLLVPRFLDLVEARAGVRLPDPILVKIPATDVTWLTFGIVYGGLVLAVAVMARHPRRLLLALQAYTLFVLFRMGLMAVTPLDPPSSIVPLVDPFVQWFGSGHVLTRDLFFSGHAGTLCLLAFVVPPRPWRPLYLGLTVAVAAAVVLQHVHYSVDVLVAPFVAYGCVRLARRLDRGFGIALPSVLPWLLGVATIASLAGACAFLALGSPRSPTIAPVPAMRPAGEPMRDPQR